MADEPPQSKPAAEAPAEPQAIDAAAGLAAGVGLAFGGATENLQDVINVVFDVVQKQQVVLASTRAELDRQRAEHELLKQRFSDEMSAMRGDLAAAQRGEPVEMLPRGRQERQWTWGRGREHKIKNERTDGRDGSRIFRFQT